MNSPTPFQISWVTTRTALEANHCYVDVVSLLTNMLQPRSSSKYFSLLTAATEDDCFRLCVRLVEDMQRIVQSCVTSERIVLVFYGVEGQAERPSREDFVRALRCSPGQQSTRKSKRNIVDFVTMDLSFFKNCALFHAALRQVFGDASAILRLKSAKDLALLYKSNMVHGEAHVILSYNMDLQDFADRPDSNGLHALPPQQVYYRHRKIFRSASEGHRANDSVGSRVVGSHEQAQVDVSMPQLQPLQYPILDQYIPEDVANLASQPLVLHFFVYESYLERLFNNQQQGDDPVWRSMKVLIQCLKLLHRPIAELPEGWSEWQHIPVVRGGNVWVPIDAEGQSFLGKDREGRLLQLAKKAIRLRHYRFQRRTTRRQMLAESRVYYDGEGTVHRAAISTRNSFGVLMDDTEEESKTSDSNTDRLIAPDNQPASAALRANNEKRYSMQLRKGIPEFLQRYNAYGALQRVEDLSLQEIQRIVNEQIEMDIATSNFRDNLETLAAMQVGEPENFYSPSNDDQRALLENFVEFDETPSLLAMLHEERSSPLEEAKRIHSPSNLEFKNSYGSVCTRYLTNLVSFVSYEVDQPFASDKDNSETFTACLKYLVQVLKETTQAMRAYLCLDFKARGSGLHLAAWNRVQTTGFFAMTISERDSKSSAAQTARHFPSCGSSGTAITDRWKRNRIRDTGSDAPGR